MSTATESTRVAVPPLARPEKWMLAVVATLAVMVGGLGLASSFGTVTAAGLRWGFEVPQVLPIGIDLAIPVFTAVNLLLIRMDMPLAWVRFVPWTLTGVTCWLNIAAGNSLSAKIAHGTMPLLWVVLSEIAAHVYAVRIGAVTGRRMEKIRRSRWLLAPVSTFALWRRMTLWEVTSYTDALHRERERQLAHADLREQYGRSWRRQTPRRTRVLLKLGDLAPAERTQPPAPPLPPPPEPDPKPRKRPAAKPARPTRTFAELLDEARKVTADWADSRLTAEGIRKAVRTSQDNARTLRETLKDERANGRPLHAIDEETDRAEGEAA